MSNSIIASLMSGQLFTLLLLKLLLLGNWIQKQNIQLLFVINLIFYFAAIQIKSEIEQQKRIIRIISQSLIISPSYDWINHISSVWQFQQDFWCLNTNSTQFNRTNENAKTDEGTFPDRLSFNIFLIWRAIECIRLF